MISYESRSKVKVFNETSLPKGLFTIESYHEEMENTFHEINNATESFKFVLSDVNDINAFINKSAESCAILSTEGFLHDAFSLFKKIIMGVVAVIKQMFIAMINFFKNIGLFFKDVFTGKWAEARRKVYDSARKATYNDKGKSIFDELNNLEVSYTVPFNELFSVFVKLKEAEHIVTENNDRINAFMSYILNTIKGHVDNPNEFFNNGRDVVNVSIKTFNGNIENIVKYMNRSVSFAIGDTVKNHFNIEYTTYNNTHVIAKTRASLFNDDDDQSFILIKPVNIENPENAFYKELYKSDSMPKPVKNKFFDYVQSTDLIDLADKFNNMISLINTNVIESYKHVDKLHKDCNDILTVAIPTLSKFSSIIDNISKYKPESSDSDNNAEISETFNLIVGLFKCYMNNLTSAIYTLRAQHSLTLAAYSAYSIHINEFNAISIEAAKIYNKK